jgi:hypothetical protein
MYSVHCAGISHFDPDASRRSATANLARLLIVVSTGALLAACAQSPSRQVSFRHDRTSSGTNPRVALATRHTTVATHNRAGETPTSSHGIASFYTEGTQTASGEKFDTHELTAAHPTLPFGTRLRVTNVATGKSMTAVRMLQVESSTFPIRRPRVWAWLERVSRTSNLTWYDNQSEPLNNLDLIWGFAEVAPCFGRG